MSDNESMTFIMGQVCICQQNINEHQIFPRLAQMSKDNVSKWLQQYSGWTSALVAEQRGKLACTGRYQENV